jgi:prepilin-type N-terminal cleavage/methylation domain-containing protein
MISIRQPMQRNTTRMKGRTNVTHNGLHSLRRQRRASQRGFSIIELLVAIIIIGVLTAILIPVVANRTEQARIARVNSDLQAITDALERAENDTGYYLRLFALNDVLRGDGQGFKRDPRNPPLDLADGLTDYGNSIPQPFLQFPGTNGLFIDPRTSDYAANVTRDEVIARLIANESTYDGSVQWNGPYVNWQKDNNLYDGFLGRDGVPDDPWGNNYLLFLPIRVINGTSQGGLVIEPTGIIEPNTVSIRSQGGFQTGGIYRTDVFDRPTVVSVGPNGLPGNGTGGTGEGTFGGGDDYIRSFGR